MVIMIGLVLLGFQVGVVGSFDFHNFDLKPHSKIFLTHRDVLMNNLQAIHFTYVMAWITKPPFPLVFSSQPLFLLGPTSKHLGGVLSSPIKSTN
jgi:hypothetical protein